MVSHFTWSILLHVTNCPPLLPSSLLLGHPPHPARFWFLTQHPPSPDNRGLLASFGFWAKVPHPHHYRFLPLFVPIDLGQNCSGIKGNRKKEDTFYILPPFPPFRLSWPVLTPLTLATSHVHLSKHSRQYWTIGKVIIRLVRLWRFGSWCGDLCKLLPLSKPQLRGV